VTSLAPFSGASTAAVLGSGVAAIVVGLRRRGTASPPAGRTGIGVWVALAGALAALQLVSYFSHPRAAHPTLSVIANAVLDPDPVRAVAFALWLAAAARWAAR
jgi:hypothetical protein